MKTKSYLLGFTSLLGVFLASQTFGSHYPQPQICDRACWSARAPQCSISQESDLTRAVIHHTANQNDYNISTLDEAKARVRAEQNYHMDVNGWCDIGYHFLVDKLGDIFEGRAGSMTSYPRGAHDGVNNQSMGFSCMGYFHPTVNNDPVLAMRNALYDVIAWRMPDAWVGPYGGGTYGTRSNVGYLCGHRDASATACPGDLLYPYIGTDLNGGEARNGVNARRAGAPPAAVHVNSITMSWVKSGKKYKTKAVVNVVNASGAAVSGATVTGDFSGSIAENGVTGATDASGNASITSTTAITTGTVTFTVTNITGNNMTYDPAANVVTSGTISR